MRRDRRNYLDPPKRGAIRQYDYSKTLGCRRLHSDAVRSGAQAATQGEAGKAGRRRAKRRKEGEDHNTRSLGDEGKLRGFSTVEAKTEVKTRGHEHESEHEHGLEQEGGGEGEHNRILRTDEEELSSKAKAKITI